MGKRLPIGAQLSGLLGSVIALMVLLLGVVLYEFDTTSGAYQLAACGRRLPSRAQRAPLLRSDKRQCRCKPYRGRIKESGGSNHSFL